MRQLIRTILLFQEQDLVEIGKIRHTCKVKSERVADCDFTINNLEAFQTSEEGDAPLILTAPVVVCDANEGLAGHYSLNDGDKFFCRYHFAVVGKMVFKHDVRRSGARSQGRDRS